MTDDALQTIPARRGVAVEVPAGRRISVVNTHGTQVVDTWAFVRHDPAEFMSMEHTRATLLRMVPRVGDDLFSNRRRALLTLVEDTSPGVHDTLLAACDSHRYALLGFRGYHDNCTDNLAAALRALDLRAPETPSPLNLFMNIPWSDAGGLAFEPPVCRPGDRVTFEARLDLVVAFSACPQDMLPINGVDCVISDAHFQLQRRSFRQTRHSFPTSIPAKLTLLTQSAHSPSVRCGANIICIPHYP